MAPPQLVDYQPEQDELEGLLHSGDEAGSDEEGGGQQEGEEPGSGEEDAAAARQRKVSSTDFTGGAGLYCGALLCCPGHSS